ncbi:MAG: S8 family serine peptidase [Saprospiraceae bacterium]
MRLLYTTILSLLFVPLLSAQSLNTEIISQALLEKMADSPHGNYSVNILLADQVDMTALDLELREQRASAKQRATTVITALQEKAALTQGRILDFLKIAPGVDQSSIRSYWVANAFVATVDADVVTILSNNPEIAWIGLNADRLMIEETEDVLLPPVVQPNGIEPGLVAIKAPALWAMGYTGYGQLSMTSDTGVDPTHPALANQYYGHYVPAEETWYEVFGNLAPTGNYTPYDRDDHGTHVTGTTLGLDRMENDTIGVAFNAKWIGALTLGSIGTADNIGAFQWSLNPDGDVNTADDMPDVINNSWWDPSLNGSDCSSVYVSIFDALETAGIAVIFSAGNNGPDPMTITQPKNIILNEVNVFTVGSLNGNQPNLPIANSSSRGPSHCPADSSLVIKPEVSAPGVSVRSAVPNNQYDLKSGTSMAAPHVSGAILLLKEAFPDLPGKDLKLALYHSCTDLGVPGEDNTFGMGIIDVLAAFNYLVDQGHTPVSPHRANDVMLVKVFDTPFYCSNAINPTIIAENAGTDTLFSFKVFYKAGNTQTNYEWVGMLPPRERVTVTLPSMSVAPGEYELSVGLAEPNGVADERPLNNNFNNKVTVTSRPTFEAIVEGPNNTACQNTSALLRGILPESLEGSGAIMDIDWYDSPFDGSLYGTGEVFNTPNIFTDVTFYADVSYTVPVGPVDDKFGSSGQLDTSDVGLKFEVFNNLTLEKVYIIAEETGLIIVTLTNLDDGSTETDVTLNSTTGKRPLQLGWDLVPGRYQLVVTNSKALAYNKDGAQYPYQIADFLSITGTTDGLGNNGVYYFFYDWEITFSEPCGRTPVAVSVGPVGSLPVAEFAASTDSVDIHDNEVIFFANTSTNATEWFWNFGDGNTSNEENPSHQYAAPGEYTVSLTAMSQDSCTSGATAKILVTDDFISAVRPIPAFENILVYPNPAQDNISIFLDLPYFQSVSLRLSDNTGRIWKQAKHAAGSDAVLEMDLTGLPGGIYFLLVEMDQGSSVWKVVKL